MARDGRSERQIGLLKGGRHFECAPETTPPSQTCMSLALGIAGDMKLATP